MQYFGTYSNCGLFSLTKPDLHRFRCSSGHVLSKTKSVTPIFFKFLTLLTHHLSMVRFSEKKSMLEYFRANVLKVDGTSFSDAGSLVKTAHLTREICPRDLKYRKSKTNMGAQKLLLSRCFFPVCPRLDQNKSCPLGVSC